MTLNSENYIARINAFTQQDWKPLLDLIPEIEKTKSFGECHGVERTENDELVLPYTVNSQLIDLFLELVYKMPIIISFNWSAWDEGREMAGNPDFDFNTIDIPTKCKLITAIVRNDRFYDCALIDAFESGLIYKILKSIENQILFPNE